MPRNDGTGPMGLGARTGRQGNQSSENNAGRGLGRGNKNGNGRRNGLCAAPTADAGQLINRIQQIEAELLDIKEKLGKL
ncbi:MAG: DUF5320 domain-containing protein [Bacteriovoracaceae bacterium]|nr:DUF5320 domain-containing protein [Bacteriovoracaceae bacterium]